MAIHVQGAAVLDDAQVVEVDPVGLPLFLHQLHEFIDQLVVCFIHDAAHGIADDLVPCEDDDTRKKQGDYTVQPNDVRDGNEDQANDNARSGIRITLQVFAACLQCLRARLPAHGDGHASDEVIHDSRGGNEDNSQIKLAHRLRMLKVRHCFVNDENTGHCDQDAFNGCGNELHLSVPVRMVFILRKRRQIKAVQPNKCGNDVDDAFQRIRQDRHRMREVPSRYFDNKQHDAHHNDQLLKRVILRIVL